jgi:vancomycin resistance protein YoaR
MTTPSGPDATMSKSARVRSRALTWAFGAASACALLLTAWFAIDSRATGRALSGVHVGALDVSGLERSQIEARMRAWATQRTGKKIALSLGGRPLEFEPKSAGFAIDAAAIAQRALEVGHAGGFFARFASFVARRFRADVVAIDVRFDAGQLNALLDEWDRTEIKDPPFSGGIAVTGSVVAPLYAHPGSRLDRPRVVAQLRSASASDAAPEPLATHIESTGVEPAEVDRVVTRAQAMLAGDTELASTDDTRRLVLSPAQTGSLLRVTQVVDHGELLLGCAADALKAVLDPQRAALEQQPKNATFVIDAKDHVTVTPSQSGLILDDRAVASALCTAAASPTRKAELPLAPGGTPALSTEAAEHAGVAGLVGSYTTRHACCQPRVQNIHHIADLLDGTLVRPGETFSVNQTIGPRTVKNGFRPAPSIEDGDMVDTVGGGVSQFATTLFNALFYGGYDILERQPHSYWFTRYPMGYDATLSYPHPDIVFKNDTDAAALIKTEYTDTTITVKIYGNNGGRRVRAEVSPRQNIVPPPVEFIPNRELDVDEEKNREGGMIGWTVVVKRTLTYPDGKIKEERRKVTYKPRARRVEVHPCRIPEGEPGHTGERCPKPKNDDDAAAASGTADAGAK